MEEVVVNGIYTRKAESFTGSAKTFKKDDLKRVGNGNIFQSLKNLDSSLKIMDNMEMGSDPNSMPDMRLRGTSTFVEEATTTGLRGNYQSQPNQPLFILDGFEVTAETIFDLDMNRVESITILKDAASKAIYGSKAAHGVVVVETTGLENRGVRISYNGNLDLEMPDLTSYNLCNSLEKLDVEMREGSIYDITDPEAMARYYQRLKKAKEGFDQYWLSLPLRTGVGTKHSVTFETGTKELQALFSASYNDVQGVMKDSYRRTFGGTAQITYRKNKFQFRDIARITSNSTQDSPYGTFSEYAAMNPYVAAYYEDGTPIKNADESNNKKYSPLYNATTNPKKQTSYLQFSNNFYIEYMPIENLKLTGRLGITTQRNDADTYISKDHGDFADIYNFGEEYKKGSYTVNNGKSTTISADIYANYTKTIKKHTIFANAGWNLSDTKYQEYMNTAMGYKDVSMDNYIFGTMYKEDGSPSGTARTSRTVGVSGVFAYTYDDRYLLDATIRANGASAFGSDNRWATFWSTGLGWNMHNEAFLKDNDWIELLKIRGSIGSTGNQNFQSNKAIANYKYYMEDTYANQWDGVYPTNMPNSGLKWEEKMDYNIGLDLKVRRVNFTFDWYRSDTENMVTSITLPASNGFTSIYENLGKVRNQGIEASLNVQVLNGKDYFLNVYGQFATNDNKLIELSDAMKAYNDQQRKIAAEHDRVAPVNLYSEGQHINTIWAVRSAGIDPIDGFEVYYDKDGNLTKQWKAENMVACGIKDDKYTGTFGLNGEYKGIGMNVTFRFLGGGERYNQTLVDKVENVSLKQNVDKRVATGRWKEVGQQAQFRRIISDTELMNNYVIHSSYVRAEGNYTRTTTRFVQKSNELNLSAISVYYDFPRKWLRPIGFEKIRLQANMNDVYKWSTIKIERGTNYPFARTLSFSLSATL
jgi:TonB-linked SusC/RagA family outer membrane protein